MIKATLTVIDSFASINPCSFQKLNQEHKLRLSFMLVSKGRSIISNTTRVLKSLTMRWTSKVLW